MPRDNERDVKKERDLLLVVLVPVLVLMLMLVLVLVLAARGRRPSGGAGLALSYQEETELTRDGSILVFNTKRTDLMSMSSILPESSPVRSLYAR